MQKKSTGALFLGMGLILVGYGIVLLAPVVWAQIVLTSRAISTSVVANMNAFAAFQKQNPAAVGAVGVVAGVVFGGIGYLMVKEKPHSAKRERTSESWEAQLDLPDRDSVEAGQRA